MFVFATDAILLRHQEHIPRPAINLVALFILHLGSITEVVSVLILFLGLFVIKFDRLQAGGRQAD